MNSQRHLQFILYILYTYKIKIPPVVHLFIAICDVTMFLVNLSVIILLNLHIACFYIIKVNDV